MDKTDRELALASDHVKALGAALLTAGATHDQINAAFRAMLPMVNEALHLSRRVGRLERQMRTRVQVDERNDPDGGNVGDKWRA